MENTNNESLIAARDIVAGGDMLVAGDAVVRRNLRVEGWLDAPNLLTPCKGLYASAEQLEQYCRMPRRGEWALVGTTFPAELYTVEDGRWNATGQMIQLTVSGSPGVPEIPDNTPSCAATCTEALSLGREALTKVDNHMAATAILPIDGVLPSRPGSRPKQGVWFERANEEHPGRFLFVSSGCGTTAADYNTGASEEDMEARTDRLFRHDNKLYAYANGELHRFAPEPYVAASEEDVAAAMLDDDLSSGRFYCVVDPATRRVISIYVAP